MSDISEIINAAKTVLNGEVAVLQKLANTIENVLPQVLDILNCDRKIIVSGMGKSGYIAQKIAATLTSTGSRAVFLHPAEAAHGDLGIYTKGDPTIILSKSGASEEISRLLPILKQFNSKIISITAKPDSPLAKHSDVVIEIPMDIENDPIGMVPTTSAVAQLAIGDAIACALMKAKGFTKENFARLHPAGQIGRNLLLSVKDIMHNLSSVAHSDENLSLREMVIKMTDYPLGGAIILEKNSSKMRGFITDGDIRRALKLEKSIDEIKIFDIMSIEPRIVHENASLGEALNIMESGTSQVSVLPVINSDDDVVGLIRLHDAYQQH